jgi:hypothetical protein
VVSDIDAPDGLAINVKDCPKIARDLDGVDCLPVGRRELMNLVRPQARIEWISLENPERSCSRSPLFGRGPG